MSEYRTIHEHIDAFRDAMRIAGVPMTVKDDVVDDGKIHRYYVDGDTRGRRNGWYIFHSDGVPSGAFGRWGGRGRENWSADKDTVKPLTREEREAMDRKREERKARQAAEEAALHEEAARRANGMWEAAKPAEGHPYLTKKGIAAHGARVGAFWKVSKEGRAYKVASDALLIAVKDGTRKIVGLQAIYAAPIQVGEELRGKDFVFGAKKTGCWATIGAPTKIDGRVTIAICEGYATGAKSHQATGLGVVVAFDSGNLLPVAREVRRLMPDADIIVLGDNDQFTTNHRGEPWNPGAEKARDAAEAVRGRVVLPVFTPAQIADGGIKDPTDFDDLGLIAGEEEVRRQILGEPPPPEPPPPEPEPDLEPDIEPPSAGLPDEYVTPPPEPDSDDELSENPYFRVLGHDRKQIYVYQFEKKMVSSRGEADWSEAALTAIAPLHWWEINFPGEKGLAKKLAINWLQRIAFKRGYFDPGMLRGRGAWRDDGRFVFHFGHKLWVDGSMMDVTDVDSAYVYEQGRRMRLPSDQPLSGAAGRKLFETFQQSSWSRPASAVLLAGFAALAPVSGALRWRPHVWITGGAGSGKTTILNLVHWLMHGTDLYAQGNSTEAGIRQALRSDALPVLFDETEQNNDREAMRVQNVLSLIRQSSTESDAKTLKGTQGGEAMDFMIRSMFCLSSIQVGMKQQADVERISVLSLRPKRDGSGTSSAAEDWVRISACMAELRADPDLPGKLLRRSLMLLPTTVQNVEVFAQAAAEKFGSQRDGDQYGTLLAGAWSLVSTKVASLDDARGMIAKYEWSDYLEGSETEESDKALAALMGRMLRVRSQDVSVFELITRAAGVESELRDINSKEAGNVLRRHGMMIRWGDTKFVRDALLLVAQKHPELERLMADTPYAADLKGQLGRLRGAERGHAERFNGVPSRTIKIPLPLILEGRGDDQAAEPDNWDDIPF